MRSSSKRSLGVCLIFVFFFILASTNLIYGQSTIVHGIIRDSVTNKPVEYATVRFDGTNVGKLSDDDGKFSVSNSSGNGKLIISLMGYDTKTVNVPINQVSRLEIKLSASGVQLGEVVIRRTKEKYSKKDNPAVELIKKVIENKHNYLVTSRDYYMNDEYDRILFALNDYQSAKGLLKNMKFLSKYADTSLIDNKSILPFSVRETTSNLYYRKNPKATRRVITAYQNQGIDQEINTESIDAIVAEVFKEVDITDNTINLLLHDFVGPLSSTSSVNFYKWYIIDTVSIDQKRYVNLGFVPFNTRDVGFIGNIYVQPEAPYAIKKVSFRVPNRINVNYVDNMLVTQEFEEKSPDLWVPVRFTTAIDLSMYNMAKFYVQKERTFSNFIFDLPLEAAFSGSAPVIYLSDYKKQKDGYWNNNRPDALNKDYRMDEMMVEFRQNKVIDITLKVADILSSQYVPTSREEEKNKLDIGTPLTFYSYNHLEGNRIRLTASTTKFFHPHFYLYGYGAYGTKDGKWKYYGEATWAFNRKNYHKDEYPRHNLSIAYKYDVNPLGQRFLQAERDNILLSFKAKRYNNMTYDRMAEINYLHEYYNGFSYNLFGRTHDENAAGDLRFERRNEDDMLIEMGNIKTTEVGLNLRYAHDEKFFQQRRRRRSLPSKGVILTLSHTIGLKDVLNGQFNYHKSALAIDKEFWIAPYGRLGVTLKGEKVWGKVPFPILLSANANSSVTIQRGSFYMLKPLEFLNDSQFTWDVSYRMGGWLFNRIPLIKGLKWREVAGFRGFFGDLNKKNNPDYNRNLMIFPEDSRTMGKKPYMEYSVGIENIFQFFRVDYVRRLNYFDTPGIDKHGFRISFDVSF
ncbi:CarboxypepD_reg-like domain-containing protein [Dysgonomonas macrotermitis]|uniref:CarboxypepD_reg-like domain-containing protein n=2 Tax=Dysgonomonas macrotermitis TaxID=1346286 RepID=A0A1M5H1K6_9BACT|nr:CarboxypepD_reg-like domain-containing protein [Dysgonomonas macrotermitis]